MADEGIKTNVSLMGDKEYKKALSDIAGQIKTLNNEMRASQSAFGDNEKSVDALRDKQEKLTAVYDAYAKKVETVKTQLAAAKEEFGENSTQVQKLSDDLNYATFQMNKTGTEIERTNNALAEAEDESERARLGFDKIGEAAGEFNNKLAEQRSALEASQSAFGDHADSVAGLSDKHEKLTAILNTQKNQLVVMEDELEMAKLAYGVNSDEVSRLQTALNKATAEMNGTQTQIDKTEGSLQKMEQAVAASDDESAAFTLTLRAVEAAEKQAAKGAEQAATDTNNFKDKLKEAGEAAGKAFVAALEATAVALAAVGAAAVGAAKAGFDMAVGAGQMADDLLTLSDKTSVSAETLQKWAYASELVDVSVETMAGSMAKMIRQVGAADKGNEAAADKFKRLGVSIKDANGQLRSSEDIFLDAVDALGKISNETQRDALAMEVFGKSAQELNPLIIAGSGALKAFGDEAVAMGAVFSGEALDAMGSMDDSMVRFTNTSKAVKNAIGLALIPAFQPLVDTATGALSQIAVALQDGLDPEEMEGIISGLVESIGGTLTDVIGLIQGALPLVGEALNGIVSALVTSLPGLVGTLLPAAMGLLQALLDAIIANVGPITAMAVDLVTQIATFLMANVDKLFAAALAIMLGLVDGIIDNLPELIPLAIEMIIKLAAALIEALPQLIARLPEIVWAIFEGLKKSIFETDWQGLGQSMMQGLANGLAAAVESLREFFLAPFQAIVDWIKGLLHISSPSQVFADIGGFIIDGLIAGFEAAVTMAVDAVKRIFGKIWDAIRSIFGFGGGESDESKEARTAGQDIMDGMRTGIESGEQSLKDSVRSVARVALDALAAEMSGAAAKMAAGIAGEAGAVWDAAWALADEAFQAVLAVLNAESGAWISEYWLGGAEKGIEDRRGDLENAARQVSEAARDACTKILNAVAGGIIGRDWGAAVASGIRDRGPAVRTAAAGLGSAALNALWETVGSGGSRFAAIGDAIAEGISRGIRLGTNKITSAARDAAQSAYNAAKAELGIASPSKVMAEIGEQYDAGFAEGIDRGMAGVMASVRSLSSMAASDLRGRRAEGAAPYSAEIDYARLGDAVADSFVRRGIDRTVIYMDSKVVGTTVEPSVSKASYRRGNRSAAGRSARMVLV